MLAVLRRSMWDSWVHKIIAGMSQKEKILKQGLSTVIQDASEGTEEMQLVTLAELHWFIPVANQTHSLPFKRQPPFTLMADKHICWAKFPSFVRKGSRTRAIPLLSTFWLCSPDYAYSAQLHDLLFPLNLGEIIDPDKDTSPHWFLLAPTLPTNALPVTPGGFSEPWQMRHSDADTKEVTVLVMF